MILIDDLGAGALVDLKPFGLPHEPTVRESIEAGADVVLFSGDKLIGAGQCGIIVGRKALIDKLRKHPLMRAVRVDKTCLMVLERTLHLFRDPARLRANIRLYRMMCTPPDALKSRAEKLARLIAARAPTAKTDDRRKPGFPRQRFVADRGDPQLCRDGFRAGNERRANWRAGCGWIAPAFLAASKTTGSAWMSAR